MDSFSDPIYETEPTIPILSNQHILRRTALFTHPLIGEVKKHVRIAMPWQNHFKYFQKPTGLPVHVTIFQYLKELERDVRNVPEKLEEILDRRNMTCGISIEQITRAVEAGPRITAMLNELAGIRRMINSNTRFSAAGADGTTGGGAVTLTEVRRDVRLVRQYKHADGKYRRAPPSWCFPKLNMQPMYQYWHCGDANKHIVPMKFFERSDVDFLGSRAKTSLSELKRVMATIDEEAMRNGAPPKEHMTLTECLICYHRGENGLFSLVSPTTPKGRKQNLARMSWGTLVKEIYE